MVTVPPTILQPFLESADAAAAAQPEVDADLARELMGEAAEMLHNSLALDHLGEHDLSVAVAALATALVAPDPAEAVRACAAAVADDDPTLHDAGGVRATYLVSLQVLGL